ncbi:stress response protein NST1 [Corylus avellana]|uniref:stress response protein NST1 n=1 Tax=Corylus avellana TaxID=13451 RepID=UPI001E230969|nr:stress response protein NST1 [Corylus avellana]
MASCRGVHRTTTQFSKALLRSFSTTSKPSHRNNHQHTHEFLEPTAYVGSWWHSDPPKDPKDAERRLALLRRDYAKQVKQRRKQYILEVELMRLELQRKDDARREALRLANEEKKKLKAEAAKVRAQERKVALEEFRQTLLKERAEKLENWRMKEKRREENKKEGSELLRRKSSLWIDEPELEKKILEAIVDTIPL